MWGHYIAVSLLIHATAGIIIGVIYTVAGAPYVPLLAALTYVVGFGAGRFIESMSRRLGIYGS
jgi:hypothetical protein